MNELRTDITAALRKAGRKITSAELYDLLDTDLPRPKIMGELCALRKTGEVVSFPGDSPRKTLYAIGAGAPPPKAAKATGKGATGKKKAKSAKPPKPRAPTAAAAPHNGAELVPAMTADKRLVILGGTEPLMFSIEQTQSIADLVFENFQAG